MANSIITDRMIAKDLMWEARRFSRQEISGFVKIDLPIMERTLCLDEFAKKHILPSIEAIVKHPSVYDAFHRGKSPLLYEFHHEEWDGIRSTVMTDHYSQTTVLAIHKPVESDDYCADSDGR